MWKEFERVQRLEVLKTLAKGKKVLHLGCTNSPFTREAIDAGMLLHRDLDKVSSELFGFDYEPESLEILQDQGFGNLFEANLEKLDEVEIDDTFDVIVAGEMIEHLSNPGLFLNGIKRFMSDETELVITTINAYCALRFVRYALRGKGGESEPVHPDHVAYYSYKTLSLMLERHSLRCERFLFYDLGAEHRPHNTWYWNAVNDVSVRFSPQLSDGVIAICKYRKD